MTKQINSPIVNASVAKEGDDINAIAPFDRPYKLNGCTYKIKPPTMNAALYVTINDTVLDDGARRPLEIFLASKDVTHAQWMIAVTRLLSAILRLRVPFGFAIDELKQVIDPQGSYFIPGGQGQCGGIVAHVARVIEEHCLEIGAIVKEEPDPQRRAELEQKKAEGSALGLVSTYCQKCGEHAVQKQNGCETCTACGESKCG